jgi:hypothetical protein
MNLKDDDFLILPESEPYINANDVHPEKWHQKEK